MMKNKTITSVGVTDEEFLGVCEEAARAFCRERKKFGTIDVNICKDRILSAFKAKYRSARGYRKNDALKQEHLLEMNAIFVRLKPKMEECARRIAFKTTAEKKTLEIKQTSVSAVIRAALEEAGFNPPVLPRQGDRCAPEQVPHHVHRQIQGLPGGEVRGAVPGSPVAGGENRITSV